MRPSIDNLLDWLRETPRTLGWNAIIAYDRSKTNVVLLQEYIAKFSTESYLPPIEGQVPTTENEVEWVYDYLIDAPRLSFENSVITASRAKLTMTVMGGSQVSIRQEPGSAPAVTRVSSYNALQGPKYTVDIDLLIAEGSVDSAGAVKLDLGTGVNPLLYFAPTLNQRTKGGQFMKGKLSSFEPEIREFMLNEIGSQAGQFLQPAYFVIRTHAEAGAKTARAANFGEGAVLLFVTMEGEANGSIPAQDEDMHFLIPAGDYSATILMGQRFLVKRILSQGLVKLAGDTPLEQTITGPSEGFAESIVVNEGARHSGGLTAMLPNYSSVNLRPLELPIGSALTLEIDRDNELLWILWTTSIEADCAITPTGSSVVHGKLNLSWRVEQAYKFQSVGSSGELTLEAVPQGRVRHCKVAPGTFVSLPAVTGNFQEIAERLESWLAAEFDTPLNQFASVVEEIDVFRLNSLLFRGANIVHFTRAQDPGDLAMLGELAPGLTEFAISPLEPRTGPGRQVQFHTDPPVPGVSWRVESIPGYTGAPGSIDSSGKYTAPAQDQIEGFFMRVRVVAEKDGYSNAALVTVLVREILVNPMIQVCGASSAGAEQTREMAAGSLSDGPLTWSVLGSSGASVRPSAIEGGDHTFVAGPANPDVHFSVEEVQVKDSAARTDSAWVLVIHKTVNAAIKLEMLDSDRAQLFIDLGEGPIPPDEGQQYGLIWTSLKGGGTLSATGVYQSSPSSPDRFAVVVGTIPAPLPIYPPFTAYIILPLPLIELPSLMTALERSDAYFKAVPTMGADQAGKILTGDA